jgi:uracil-DNA glycosylase
MTGQIGIRLAGPGDIAGWRAAARRLDAFDVAPEQVLFTTDDGVGDLFAATGLDSARPSHPSERRRVPPAFLMLADQVLLHRDPGRFGLMYRLLRRLREEPRLLDNAADLDVARAQGLAKSVRRDKHKMKAFVRFRKIDAPDGGEAFVAWFEPTYHIVAATAPFFTRRFANMRWSILTPDASAHWDTQDLVIGAGASRADAPDDDRLEDIWRTYFASIFNPARLKIKAMTAEMPKKYWHNLPEARLIAPLVRGAKDRASAMVRAGATVPQRRVPVHAKATEVSAPTTEDLATVDGIHAAARSCQRCPLYRDATQTVTGEGPATAALMFVGEQPGDQEDLTGRAFVGPAGKVFDAALERAGLDRRSVYVTNAVKHFKFEPRGKRRIHKSPSSGEIDACRWWLDAERRVVGPELLVVMGASAVRALLGRSVALKTVRGQLLRDPDGAAILVTVHPAYLLRLTDPEQKLAEWHAFLSDIRRAAAFVGVGRQATEIRENA